MSDFGTIRSLLHSTPSAETWRQLVEALDGYQGAEPLEAVLRRLLDRWPQSGACLGAPPSHHRSTAPVTWATPPLSEAVEVIASSLRPVVAGILAQSSATRAWSPRGPWR